MTDQPQQFNTGEYIDKAKDYAQQNPDHARSAIDKVEDFIDAKTGGKYSNQVDQAGDWLEGQLGMANNTNNPDPQAPADAPADPAVDPADAPRADAPQQPIEPLDTNEPPAR